MFNGRGINELFYLATATIAISVPLAIWKVVDIVIWIYEHVQIGLK